MTTYFAVVPDGQTRARALFIELQDAIDWALAEFGANKFSIRGWQESDADLDAGPNDAAPSDESDEAEKPAPALLLARVGGVN